MGVQSLYVEGHPVHQEGDRGLTEQLVDLEHRFSKTMDNHLNLILLEIYRNQLKTAMGDDCGRTEE